MLQIEVAAVVHDLPAFRNEHAPSEVFHRHVEHRAFEAFSLGGASRIDEANGGRASHFGRWENVEQPLIALADQRRALVIDQHVKER